MAQQRATGAKDLVITCIKGDGTFLKFWALPLTALDTVKKFENHFSNLKSELESLCGFTRSEQIPVGSKCVVKSQIKQDRWCRAGVLRHQNFNSILVQLLDYGNEDIVLVSNVRTPEDHVMSYPAQAIECILADVTPVGSEWSEEAIAFCEQHLLYNTLSCFVVSEYMKLPIVRVAKKGEGGAFVQRLIDRGLALFKRETSTPPSTQPISYKMNNMDPNAVHLVRVSCIENAHKFYVQLSPAEVELKCLMDAINRIPRENHALLKLPAVNTPCLAMLSTKPCYYRALITYIQQNRCRVFFVDYGFTEMKEVQELRAIHPSFLQLSAQAICCSLPKEADIDTEQFKRMIGSEHLELTVLNRVPECYIVKLSCQGRDLLISPMLPQNYVQQKINPGSKCEVIVSYLNDVSEFHCQLNQLKDQLNIISKILNSGYNFVHVTLNECTPGKPVCVKFSEDSLWYRARIVKVNHENDIEVFFVDYGNYDNVGLNDISKIGPDLLQIPIQAFKCFLYETPIPSDSKMRDDAFELLEELTLDQCLLAHVNSFSVDAGYGITLYMKNSMLSVNEKLQSSFLSIPVVPVNEIENVYVTVFNSPLSFYVQFEKLDSDQLDKMQEEINTFYSGRVNNSFVPKEGNLVCARFNEDGQYYRARVEKCKDMFCDVFFIDYGNKETTPTKDVHCIDPKFTKYPQFGTECSLDNCSQVPSDKLCNAMLENSFQVKMIRKEEDKWHVSLVENHPGNAMILKLIRDSQAPAPRSIHGTGLGGYQERSNIRPNQTDSWNNNMTKTSTPNFNSFQPPKSEETFSKRDFPQTKRDEKITSHNDKYVEKDKSFFSEGHVNKPNSYSNEEHIKESPKKAESTQQFEDYWVMSIPSKACRNVYVSFVANPGEFYCQIEEENSNLLSLMKKIEDTYSTSTDDLNIKFFSIDAPCCAMYEDGEWYRGKIKKVNNDSCLVFFVDYGNTDAVSKSKIKILKKEFFRWPIQAVCCKAFNLSPKGRDWSDDETNAFINMTVEKSFIAQFVDCDSSHCYSVNLVSIGKLENDIFNKEFVTLGYGRLQDSNKSLVLNPHAASTNLSFSLLDVTVGSSESVQVTFGLNPGEIFCQLKSNASEFNQMMINLQKYYNNVSEAECLIDRPHQGMICVAQFHLDCAWYRAEIKKVEAKKITVFFVDYGNAEAVDRKKIRSITQDYTTLPIQAVKCRIRGIKPPGKSWTVNDNLCKYFEGNAVCKFISKEDDFYLVDMTCNQKNVAEWLISDKYALPDESLQTKTDTSIIKSVQEESPKLSTVGTDLLSPSLQQQVLPMRSDSFVPGQLLSVTVSFVESPLKFWCQLLDESEILDEIMANIESNISEYSLMSSATAKIGSFCVAQYSEDEAWYRAQVKSSESESSYKVFFVDYGNSEIVSLSEMKSMPPELTSYPPQCFECSLLNTPSKILPEMTVLFRDTIADIDEITAKVEYVKSGISTVTLLFDKDDQEMNISELLFGITEPSHENGVIAKEYPSFTSPDVPLGLHEGYVSVVNSPQDFYIQLAGTEDSLADLSEVLAEVSGSSVTVNENTLCVGFACFTKYSEDDNWYRAQVIDLQDSTARVLFVDYGNVETVEKNNLKILSQEHLQMPPQAIKCKLNGIVPSTEEWSQEAIDTFQNMVLDSCLGVTFISKDIPASVNITKDDKEIAQYLVEMELANFESSVEADEAYAEDHLAPAPVEDPLSSLPSDQSYPTRKLSSSKHKVKICYIDSYDKFFVMPLELSTELDTVMATLDILYASDSQEKESNSDVPQILEDPKVSMPCVAKYSEDDAWYRALITEIDKDNIYVTFVDYGNSEITTVGNLRPLTPELVKIPPIALECSLFGIEAIPDKEQVITNKLEYYYVEELELEMEIIEFSPFKIKLFHNGDVASNFIKDGLAKEKTFISTETEICAVNSKINFEVESLDMSMEYHIQISKRFFSGADKIVGNVKFCEIENDLVVFHVVSTDLEDDLQDLQQKLQDAYCETSKNLENISCMDFCATKYMEDGNWYRAQVLSCEKDKFKVRFIDYGNCETVDKSDIYELLADFTIEPQFSVKCILFGLKVNKNKEIELQNQLDEHVYHEPVELKLCKHSHVPYDLCITSVVCGDIDITEILLNEKLAFHQYVINSQLDTKFKAVVSKIEGGIVFLLPCSVVDERDAFQLKLQNYCKDSDLLSKVNKEYLCAAKVDDIWYRVSVMNISESEVTVDLVDFGSTKVVSIFDFVPLPLDICHQPIFLQPCVIKIFESQTGNTKNIDVNDLSIGCKVLCELQNSYPIVHPISVKLVEIIPEEEEKKDSLKEQDIEAIETTESKDSVSLEKYQQIIDRDGEQHDADAFGRLEKEKLFEENAEAVKESDSLESYEPNDETGENFDVCENEISTEKYEKLSDSLLGKTNESESEHSEKMDSCENIKFTEDLGIKELNFKSDASEENVDIIEADNVERDSTDLEEIESNTIESNASKENENKLENASTQAVLEDLGKTDSDIDKDDAIKENESPVKAGSIDKKPVDELEKLDSVTSEENENISESRKADIIEDFGEIESNTVESGEADTENRENLENIQPSHKVGDASMEDKFTVNCDFKEDNSNAFAPDFLSEKDKTQIPLKENFESQPNQLEIIDAFNDNEQVTPSDFMCNSEVYASKPLSSKQGTPEKNTDIEAENCFEDFEDTHFTMSLNSESSKYEPNLTESLPVDEKDGNTVEHLDVNSLENKSFSQLKNIEHIFENMLVEKNETLTEFDDVNHEENLNYDDSRDFAKEEIVNSPNDTIKENNRGIEDSYQLAGSVQVKVSHVAISDGSVIFAVQPLYLKEEFLLLKQSMQEFYSEKAIPYDSNLCSNYCVVYHEGEWCRGKILESGDTTILLIDYGNCTSVDISNIKALDNDHVNVPPFAVWCTLSSVICPPEKCEATRAFLCDKLKDCDAIIKVLEGGEPYKINLYIDDLSILNLLLKNNLVTQKLPEIYLEPGPYKAKLSFLNLENVEIFVNLLSFSDNQNALFESMQNSYKVEESVSNIVESGIYATQYNDFWYRGLVTSSGNHAQVYLVDTGETVTSCKNFSFLLPEHCLQPAFAIPCQIPLTDVQATNKIIESVSNVLKAAEFSVSIQVCEESNSIKAILTDEHIASEVESIKLSYIADSSELDLEKSNPVEVKSCDSNNLDLSPNNSSNVAKVPEQGTSEQLVSYIEETFTTEPS